MTAAPIQLNTEAYINGLGKNARMAAKALANATTAQKNQALMTAARQLRTAKITLLAENAEDVKDAQTSGKPAAFIDRLLLTDERVEAMATALETIADLPDPVGRLLAQFDRPNGLVIQRVACPLGVIAMIYESRPNVGAEAGALCLKSGNGGILRGGF